MNVRRGHESEAHRSAKLAVAKAFQSPRWSVLVEYQNCDLVVFDTQSNLRLAVEVERSTRNLIRNAQRNLAAGCNALAVVDGTNGRSIHWRHLLGNLNPCFQKERIRFFDHGDSYADEIARWAQSLADEALTPRAAITLSSKH